MDSIYILAAGGAAEASGPGGSAGWALLIAYVLFALLFSFLCSIFEAVLLSVTRPYIANLRDKEKATGSKSKAGEILTGLKKDVNRPLAAILTLNTIAHTVGASMAGGQAAAIADSLPDANPVKTTFMAIFGAVFTLIILIGSEIIPKSLGAMFWRKLAPICAICIKWLVWLLYPFVVMSEWITKAMTGGKGGHGASMSREEFSAMADIAREEGQLNQQEFGILRNLLRLREFPIDGIMTPRTVVYSLPAETTIGDYKREHNPAFSRIPIYESNKDHIIGFFLKSDALKEEDDTKTIADIKREITTVSENANVASLYEILTTNDAHISLAMDEYGGLAGIVTLEDVLETLLGLEIVDEHDLEADMRAVARRSWLKRAERMGIDINQTDANSSSSAS